MVFDQTVTPVETDQRITGEVKVFFLGFLDNITQSIVEDLREFFRINLRTPERFRWHEDRECSKIWISNEYPEEERKFPYILVTDVSGNVNDFLGKKMGDLLLESTGKAVGTRRGGKAYFTVTLKVATLSTPDRNQLTDTLLHALSWPVYKEMAKRGLPFAPNTLATGGEIEEPHEGSERARIYSRTVTFQVVGEWWDDFYWNGVTMEDITTGDLTYLGPPVLG